MNRMIVSFFTLVMLAMLSATTQAQYAVKSSDTLWGIAEKNTEPKIAWQKIYDANPFLQEPGRRFVDGNGRTIVVIYEGEVLMGVNSEGLVPTPSPTVNPTPTQKPITIVSTEPYWFEKLPWWLVLLLLAIPAAFLLGLFLNWLYRRSPTEWRPMVAGGVDDQSAESRFNRYAQRRGGTVIPGSVRKVRLYGVWGTQHRNVPISVPHRYHGERAYAARFRMPNGTEREGIMLQGCGNDVASGAWYVEYPGARIEEGWGEENSSTQNPTTSASGTTQSEPTSDAAASAVADEGKVKFEYRPATDDNQEMFRLSGADKDKPVTFEATDEDITIRFSPKGKR